MSRRLIVLGLLLLLTLPLALAQDAPQEVRVGTYVLSLSKFDVSTGSFTADFYLSLQCDGECPSVDLEFMNGRAASSELIINETDSRFYRIQAALSSPVDLRRFPFDEQHMEIILEDKRLGRSDVVFVPLQEQTGIDPSIVFTGWNIDGWRAAEREHRYEVYDETYSQYVYSIDISRALVSSVIKTFLPVIFIVLVMLSSFVLDPDKISTRLAMVGSSLVASVMFHVSLANQVPSIGYLTFADKFMVLTYFVMLASFVMNVTMLELLERKKEALVEKVHRRTEFAMFIVVPLLYVVLFLLLL